MINKICAEIYKNYIFMKRYPIEVASDFLLYILIFGAIYYSSKGNYANQIERNQQLNRLLMSYMNWVFLSGVLNYVSNNVTKEMTLGTINPLVLCDIRLVSTFIVRSLVYAVRLCMIIIPLAAFGFWITGSEYTLGGNGIIILVIMSVGALGLSLLMGGLILRYKTIGKLTFLISVLFLGTTMFDLKELFSKISYAKYLFPFIEGQQLLKDITHGNAITPESYILLGINAIAYFIIGVSLFNHNYKKARLRGELSKI